MTNTYVGVREVDRGVVDAARGAGMSGRQILRRVELPLATPLIMNGVRLATVQVVATATIAALVAGGGLGRIITQGFADQNIPQLVSGRDRRRRARAACSRASSRCCSAQRPGRVAAGTNGPTRATAARELANRRSL